MPTKCEPLIFVLTLAGAAALLFSIAIGEILLAAAVVAWIAWRPRHPNLPSFFIPMCAFAVTTLVSLILSSQPQIGWGLRKTTLWGMALLSATFVTTVPRARTSHATLLAVATIT